MLILSNALTDVIDEGCVKVAYNLVKRIKNADKSTVVVSFDRRSDLSDEYISVNKLLINRKLIKAVRKNKGKVVYIPFPAKTASTALRVFIMSLFAGNNFKVILCMTSGMDIISKLLFKISCAKFFVFSKKSFELYSSVVGEKRVTYLKTGVDTEKFLPVSEDKAKELKIKYGFDPNQKLVIHVGHINRGRNVQQLIKLTKRYQVLLVSSTLTKNEQDMTLKNELLSHGVRIIDTYVKNIEEIYQMSDAYFFPVKEEGKCIDVPLSCLEASSCNKPIVTTDFGEMKEFIGKDGYYFIESFTTDKLEEKIAQALRTENLSTRLAVMDYDWHFAIDELKKG